MKKTKCHDFTSTYTMVPIFLISKELNSQTNQQLVERLFVCQA